MSPNPSGPPARPAAGPDLLTRLGWADDLVAAYAPHDRPGHRVGRVHRVDRGRLHVRTADGPVVVDDAVPAGADPAEAACTGDWVVLRAGPDCESAVAVLPRRTVLRRASPGGDSRGQALAANCDAVALVEGLAPLPDLTRLERMLVLLWESGAAPLIVLTKADLVADATEVAEDVAAIAPAVPVLTVSSHSGAGLDGLTPHVAPGRTLALLGRSGAGKSTLANRLVGEEVLATREIRADGKGRHTTVRRELLLAAAGGALIDTPGLRGAGLCSSLRSSTGFNRLGSESTRSSPSRSARLNRLWSVEEGVEQVFGDVAELTARCRFADCSHEVEPGCAVAAALADGTLNARRWGSYQKLRKEAAWIASRTDARLRAERAGAWKRVEREMRRSGRSRP